MTEQEYDERIKELSDAYGAKAEALVGLIDDLREFVYADELDKAENANLEIGYLIEDLLEIELDREELVMERGIE